MGGTKMDKDILARTMEQLRSRVTHRQVASGREFKGRPFNSKPELIHFKVRRDAELPGGLVLRGGVRHQPQKGTRPRGQPPWRGTVRRSVLARSHSRQPAGKGTGALLGCHSGPSPSDDMGRQSRSPHRPRSLPPCPCSPSSPGGPFLSQETLGIVPGLLSGGSSTHHRDLPHSHAGHLGARERLPGAPRGAFPATGLE